MKFWYPLMESLGVSAPKFHIPYLFMYFFAFLMELLYVLFGLEPLMTRMELNLVAITNTFSIESAREDFGYAPRNNHSLKAVIKFYENLKEAHASRKYRVAGA